VSASSPASPLAGCRGRRAYAPATRLFSPKRQEGLSKEDQAKAGLDLCCEVGQQVREIEGVRGLHIMAVNWPASVPQVCERLGLLPRPTM
jgi:hypothetical protein